MTDEECMRECLRLAAKGRGRVSPNPLVGAVLVKSGRIVSRGYHHRFGGPHAEVECLKKYTGDPKGTTLYVNLEPCAHFGKTPPCADLIIRSGVRRVVASMKDPNPLVAGRGFRKLRRAGVTVVTGVLEGEAKSLNRHFVTQMVRCRPFVHLKIAQSLDGYITTPPGMSRWITSPASRRLVHQWRAEHDAVLVGAGTVAADDPRLDVRLARGRNPQIVVLDGRLTISADARLLRASDAPYVVVTRQAARKRTAKIRNLVSHGAIIIPITGKRGRVPLTLVLQELYRRGIGSILVEGGAEVFGQFLEERLPDQISLFVAPRIVGKGLRVLWGSGRSMKLALSRTEPSVRKVGPDILIQAFRD
jgi:diaminohydroxyphosphoribosylaminopyrimidine deaminase/5-amino-6-(5-phosphoribosylamino)uracil reductase